MACGATTASSAWAWASPSEGRWRLRVTARRGPAFWLRLLLGAGSLLLLAQSAHAQPARTLWQQGDFEAAYEAAVGAAERAAQGTAAGAAQGAQEAPLALWLLAARAAADQAVYALAPAGSAKEAELAWLKRSAEAAEQAVGLGPDSAAAHVALARAKGEVARRSGVLQNLDVASELKRLFDRALALEPDHPDALVGLAMWHLELVENGVGWLYGGRREAVLPLLGRGVAAAPAQLNLRVEYATALRALGDEAGALEQLEAALALPALTAVDRAEQRRARALMAAP